MERTSEGRETKEGENIVVHIMIEILPNLMENIIDSMFQFSSVAQLCPTL